MPSDWVRPVFGAIAISVGVFLVLPLTQMVSSNLNKKFILSQVDAAAPPPPPPPSVDEPPPPDPEPPEPPPPDISEQPQQLNLSQLDLDMSIGGAGALGAGFDAFATAAADLAGSDIFDVSELDSPPRRLTAIPPRVGGLPKESGVVVALFVVDENGRVMDPRIESSHRPEFEKPVLDALQRWRFAPGKKAGDSVKTYVRQSFPFTFR